MDVIIELLIAVTLVGAGIMMFVPNRLASRVALLVSLVPLAGSLWMFWEFDPQGNLLLDETAGGFEWAGSGTTIVDLGVYEIQWIAAVDGLSLPLVVLSTLLTTLAIVSSWSIITEKESSFYALLLFLEAALIGVFTQLDFFMWFIFWEAVLVPMYFLIGVWGGPRRKYAAIKFFIYTNVASLVMFVGFIALVVGLPVTEFDIRSISQSLHAGELSAMFGISAEMLRLLAFGALFVGFAVKVPVVPFHTWLPDAHVEAPAPVSVILAGVLLKMGTYALLRYNVTMLPDEAVTFAIPIAAIAVVSIIYGALLALAQRDLKRIVAYSSVSSMGYVLLGLVALTVYGIGGATFHMISHGLIAAALFMAVGIIYHVTQTRMVTDISGLVAKLPVLSWLFVAGAFAYLGLPGMSGFAGELFVFIGAFDAPLLDYSIPITAVAMFGIVIVAGYLLYAMQQALFGPFELPDASTIERPPRHDLLSLAVLIGLIILLGIVPDVIFNMIETASSPIEEAAQDATGGDS